jgi:hypothetical protein
LVLPAAESGKPVRISNGPPTVDIALTLCDRFDWNSLADLNPDDADARVVAQALHAKGAPSDRKLVLSHDVNTIAKATQCGLKARLMPDDWIAPPEPSPHDRELQKLKDQLKVLESAAPALEATITFSAKEPLQLFKVTPLTKAQKQWLIRRVRSENPPEHRGIIESDFDYDERYERYQDIVVPRYAACFHEGLEAIHNQIPFLLHIQNTGHVQADNLIVALQAFGGGLHNRFLMFPTEGPPLP